MQRSLIAIALLLACALPAAAQTTYAPSGDTLRFRQVTQAKITLTSPQGEIPVTIEHRALVSVVRTKGDSARAWFDSLMVASSSPAGDLRPATDSALRTPYLLTFDPRGRVRVVQVPKFPATFEGITDLTRQFDDFFLRLPDKPLAIGLAWSDSATRSDTTNGRTSQWATNVDYRVERDTVVGGVPALIVGMKQRVRVNGEGPVPNQPMRATVVLEGTDDGFVVFAPRAGRMLGRRHQGSLQGDIFLKGGQGEMRMKQAYSYTGTVDAVR
ncbi:MAG: hypothetical protein ABIP93_00820 [Gemmatimonadaceae bacterium]